MFEEKKGKGYDGYSMSVNAREAYSSGEMPMSYWTKAIMLEGIEEVITSEELDLDLAKFKKISAAELRIRFLKSTVGHHTSKFYNYTMFYEIDVNFLKRMTNDWLDEIAEVEKAEKEATKEKRKAQKEEAEARRAKKRAEKQAEEEKMKLFKYQNRYKTASNFLRLATPEFLESLKIERVRRIEEKRAHLKEVWTKQGREDFVATLADDAVVERRI